VPNRYVPRSIQNIFDRVEAYNESITKELFSEELPKTFEVVIYDTKAPETKSKGGEAPADNSTSVSNYYFYKARSLKGHHDMLLRPETASSIDEYERLRNQHFQAIIKKKSDIELPQTGDVWLATSAGGNLVTLVSLQRKGNPQDFYIIGKSKAGSKAHKSGENPTGTVADYSTADIQNAASRLRASGTAVPGPSIPKVLTGDEQLAKDAGIPLAVLRAFRAVEAGNLPASSVRFEPHLWKRHKGSNPPKGYTPKSDSEKWSIKNSETNKAAFLAAYAVDKDVAVKSTSFGYYQVLGDKAIAVYGSAEEFWTSFDGNAEEASGKLLIKWFNDNPSAQSAANSLDFTTLAEKYNGSKQSSHYYDIRLAEAYKKALELE